MKRIEIQDSDTQFEEKTIARVELHEQGFTLTFDDGWCFAADHGPLEPKPGMTARLYGKGLGFNVRGLLVDGQVFFYRSEEEDQRYWADHFKEQKRQAKAAYEQGRETQLQDIAQLPLPYQSRLAGFMERAPETAWEHQGYELHICKMAVLMAEDAGEAEQVERRHDSHWRRSGEALERLLADASGNQVGAAARLAYLQLTAPEGIAKEHAGLCPLVGCQKAGCWALTQTGVEA